MLTSLPGYEAFARQRTFYRLFTSVLCLFSLTMFSHFSFAQSGPPQEWFKKYGGSGEEVISSWVETDDGYLIGGSSRSGAGPHKTDPSRGGLDYWIIKLDKNGNKVWDKTYGGSSDDLLKVIVKTSNGFLLAGSSQSGIGGDKTAPNKGDMDFWVIEISVNGIKQWEKTYGGYSGDQLVSASPTSDGGFILGGNSSSSISEDKSENARPYGDHSINSDYWVVKINSTGLKIFDKTFGGGVHYTDGGSFGGEDVLVSALETSDGGFILAGYSHSFAGFDKSFEINCDPRINNPDINIDFCEFYDAPDYWLIKINSNGAKEWDWICGGDGSDVLLKAFKGQDGKFLLVGSSYTAPIYQGNIKGSIWTLIITEDREFIKSHYQELSSNIYSPSYISAGSDGSYYYIMLQGSENNNIVIQKYYWSSALTEPVWTKTLTTLTPEEGPGISTMLNGDFVGIGNSGELLLGLSAYMNNNSDYLIYKFQSEAHPFSKFFYGGVDLNSANASTKVGDLYYQGDKFFPNFSYSGRLFENQSIPLEPAPDAEKAKMIRSVVASRSTVPAVFNFNNIPQGTYEIYLYTWEDNFSTSFSIDIQDQRVLYDYNSGTKGSWAKLGPFKTNVTDSRTIKMEASGGDANISGIELWRVEEGVLERAINLNSSSDAIVGEEVFEASRNAPDFSFTGRTFENQSVALAPKTGDNEAKMIRSSIYATRFSPATLNIGTQSSGAYAVYLYIWEDNYMQHFTLDIDGQVVYNGNSGNKGQWQLLGPFNIVSGDNQIVIKASGGDAMLSGVKLYRLNNPSAFNLRTAVEEVSTASENAKSFNAYPIPLEGKLNVVLPETYKGKGSIAITDPMGQTFLHQEKEYTGEKGFSIDLPALKSGVYYLKVQYGSKSEIKRLIKE